MQNNKTSSYIYIYISLLQLQPTCIQLCSPKLSLAPRPLFAHAAWPNYVKRNNTKKQKKQILIYVCIRCITISPSHPLMTKTETNPVMNSIH
jgi:hypothetical protein